MGYKREVRLDAIQHYMVLVYVKICFFYLQSETDFVCHSFGNSRYEFSLPTVGDFGGTSRDPTAC